MAFSRFVSLVPCECKVGNHSHGCGGPGDMRWNHLGRTSLVVAWLAVVGCGFLLLYRYQTTPGSSRPPGPEGSAPNANVAKPCLMLFLHPRCACSRATLAELARLLNQAENRPQVTVYFYRPAPPAEPWEPTDLWASAARLPDVRLGWDDGGVMARHYGAETSGDCRVYDETGRLRYRGGLTASRSHEGDNVGRRAVLEVLAGSGPPMVVGPVFGCPLVETGENGKES